MTRARSILGLFVLMAVTPRAALEAQSYTYGYLSHVEGEIILQRATEAEPEAGAVNVPVMPGDRLWTPSRSRAELAFADGTRVRVDESTKLDVVEAESELLLRVWSGSVIVLIEDTTAGVRIDTPSGSVFPAGEGLYRIDLDGEHLALTVTRGSAELAGSESSVVVRAGETSESVTGSPTRPYAFNTARLDAFDQFSESLDAGYRAGNDVVIQSLPHEVHYATRKLHHHGEWYREPDYGWVWYPHASVAWAPYRHGRWGYTRFGYTWISYEPWGWAPYHYGRWGYGHRGWYWIPGAYWSPAWVSFAFGPTWVGWSPLGFHGRAVFGFDTVFHPHRRRYRGGHAVPRHVYDDGAGWNFVGRQQFTAGSGRARLRAAHVRASADGARLLDSGAVLGRDLRPRGPSTRAAVVTSPSRAIERRSPGRSTSRSGRVERLPSDRARAARAQAEQLGRRDSVESGSRATSGTSASTLGATARSRYGNRESPRTDSGADRSVWRERATGSGRSTVTDRGGRGTSPATRTPGRSRTRTPARERNDGSSTLEPSRRSGNSAWRERAGRDEGSTNRNGNGNGIGNGRMGNRSRSPRPATTRGRANTDGSNVQRSSRPFSDRFESSRGQGSRSNVRAPASSGPSRARPSAGRPSRSAGRPAAAAASSRSGAAKARRRQN